MIVVTPFQQEKSLLQFSDFLYGYFTTKYSFLKKIVLPFDDFSPTKKRLM
jgi:hypothetical protein